MEHKYKLEWVQIRFWVFSRLARFCLSIKCNASIPFLYVIRQITHVTTSCAVLCVCVCVIAVHILPVLPVFCLIIVSLYYCTQIVFAKAAATAAEAHMNLSFVFYLSIKCIWGNMCLFTNNSLLLYQRQHIHTIINLYAPYLLYIYKCKMRFVLYRVDLSYYLNLLPCAIYWPTYRLFSMWSRLEQGEEMDYLIHTSTPYLCVCVSSVQCVYIGCMWAIIIRQLVLLR